MKKTFKLLLLTSLASTAALLYAANQSNASGTEQSSSGTNGIISAIENFHKAYSLVNTKQLDDDLSKDAMLPTPQGNTPILWQDYLTTQDRHHSDIEGIYATYQTLMNLNLTASITIADIPKLFAETPTLTVNNVTVPSHVMTLAADAKRIRLVQESLRQCIKTYKTSQNSTSNAISTSQSSQSDPITNWAHTCKKNTVSSLITTGNTFLNQYAKFGFSGSITAGDTSTSSDFVFAQAKTSQIALENLQDTLEKVVLRQLYDLTSSSSMQTTNIDPTHDKLIAASAITTNNNACPGQNILTAEHGKAILQLIDQAYPLDFTLPTTLIPSNQTSLALIPYHEGQTLTRNLYPSLKGRNDAALGSLATTIAQRRQGYLSDIQEAEDNFIQSVTRLHATKTAVINDAKFLLQERTPVDQSKPCQTPITIMQHNSTWRAEDSDWQEGVSEFTATQALRELARMKATELANQYKLYLMQARILSALSDLRLMTLNDQRSLVQTNQSTLSDLITASDKGSSSTTASTSGSLIASMTGSSS